VIDIANTRSFKWTIAINSSNVLNVLTWLKKAVDLNELIKSK